MKLSDFKIGQDFTCNRRPWRVTDIGSRVVVAIPVRKDWMAGPPYAQAETVFNENDLPVCEPV